MSKKQRPPLDPWESEAARVLIHFLGGAVAPRDVNGAQNTRDFDLVDADGVTAQAVEVTSGVEPKVRAAQTAMKRAANERVGLTRGWSVTVHERAQINPLKTGAPVLLNELVGLGYTKFDVLNPRPMTAPRTSWLI